MNQIKLSFSALLNQACSRYRDRPLLSSSERTLSYKQFEAEARCVAAALAKRGIGRGDRVAILLRNCLEFLVVDYAIMKLGAVKIPLNEMLSADDVEYIFTHAKVRGLVVHTSLAYLVPDPSLLTACAQIVDADGDDLEIESFDSWLGEDSRVPELCHDADALAAVLYTGGTTGRPKGVMHTQGTIAAVALSGIITAEIAADERLLLTTPLPHAAGICMYSAMLQGGSAWVAQAFDAEATLKTIAEQKITWLWAVPTMIYRLLDAPGFEDFDLASLRTIVYGAAPITQVRLKQGLACFGPVFLQIYGQTEAPMWMTALSKHDHLDESLLGSCGTPAVGAEVCIKDDSGNTLPYGEVGELCLRAPLVMQGYYEAPELTAESFFQDWLRSGDLGYQREAGHVFLVDRAKDMIISGGMNVYCSEVENVVQGHVAVSQVAVIGIPDDDWGEAVHAVVVANAEFDTKEFIGFCKERLAKYKVPKSVSIVDAIPVTAYGKMDKKALRGKFWGDGKREIN